MRPQAGVGKLKLSPPLQANDFLVVAQAVSPANRIILQLLTVGALSGAPTVREGLPSMAQHHTVADLD